MLVACTSSTSGTGTGPSIAGRWSVTYGAPTVVTISASRHSSYTMTGARVVTVVESHCRLRVGTLLARFTGTGDTYSGRHGLWNVTTCAFAGWTTMRLTLAGDTASAQMGNGSTITYRRLSGAVHDAAVTNASWWPWLVVVAVVVLIAVLVSAYARHRRRHHSLGPH